MELSNSDDRRWVTKGTGLRKKDLGPSPRRVPNRRPDAHRNSVENTDGVKRSKPSASTSELVAQVKARNPHLFDTATRSDKLTEEAHDRDRLRGPRIVQTETEYTRYSTHPNGLDRMLDNVDWSDPKSVIHRTDPILTATRDTAKRVRKQYRHLGGTSKLQDAMNDNSPILSRFVRNNRRAG